MPRSTKKIDPPPAEQRRRMKIRPAYLVLAAVMALFAWKFIEKTQQIQQLRAQYLVLQYQNQRTAEDNARIQQGLGYYKTLDYVRQSARENLGFAMPGEVPVEVSPRSQPRVQVRSAPPPRYAAAPVPVWRQWWDVFFG